MQTALAAMGAFRTLDAHARTVSRRQIRDALRRGLLISEAEFVERASRAPYLHAPNIATIGIAACGPSPALDRAHRSYAANVQAFGRTVRFVTAGSGDERRSACVSLAAEKIDPRLAKFALLGDSGAARNALLLETCGEPFLLVDGDTVCGLSAINLIGEFSRALGPPVTRGAPFADPDCDDRVLAALLAGRAQVDVAVAAIGAAPERFSLSETGAVALGCIALDHRRLIPPFPPLGPAEGETFGVWLRAANPWSLTARLPLAVTGPSAQPASALGANDVVRLFSEAFASAVPGDFAPPERLMWLGARLRETGALPLADFRHKLLERRMDALSREIIPGKEARVRERKICGSGILDGEDLAEWRSYTEWCGRLLEGWPAMTAAAVRLRHARRLWPSVAWPRGVFRPSAGG